MEEKVPDFAFCRYFVAVRASPCVVVIGSAFRDYCAMPDDVFTYVTCELSSIHRSI